MDLEPGESANAEMYGTPDGAGGVRWSVGPLRKEKTMAIRSTDNEGTVRFDEMYPGEKALEPVRDWQVKPSVRERREDHLVAVVAAALPRAFERFSPNAVMSGADMDTETRRIGYFAAFVAFAAMKKIDEAMAEWEARP